MNDLSIGTDTSRAFGEFVRSNQEAKTSLGKMEFTVQVQSHLSHPHLIRHLLMILTCFIYCCQVLTTGNWPTYKVMDINLPPMMQRCVQLFQQYYNMEVRTH